MKNNFKVSFHFTKNAAKHNKIYLGQLKPNGQINWAKKKNMGNNRRYYSAIANEGDVFMASYYGWDSVRWDGGVFWFVIHNAKAVMLDRNQAKALATIPRIAGISEATTALISKVAIKMIPDWLDIFDIDAFKRELVTDQTDIEDAVIIT